MRSLIIILCYLVIMSPATREGTAATGNLEIYFLDVGQGDAIILHQPGHCTSLIDAGPPIHGYRVTEKLQELNVQELDFIIITHPHLDHYGGLFDLAPRIPIKRLYDNGVPDNTSMYTDNYQLLRNTLPHDTVRAGDNIVCGSTELTILHPAGTELTGKDFNAESIVVLIKYSDSRILLMGDLAGETEKIFARTSGNLQADVIKIGHHGADDATSEELLTAVQPRYAIISTATENRINAPSPTVLNRLTKHRITYFRTDKDKTVKLDISGKKNYLLNVQRIIVLPPGVDTSALRW